ncbi:hypothetical protein [Peptacetobacter sp. AB800]|uniref:hypothetical protein n=1 Tax=Peptacetobacter sp. AB800 TaxID=3388428 RepID=UPI0039FCB9EB
MKIMSIYAVYKEAFGDRELERLFTTYDKAREYISSKKDWDGTMIIKELEIED